MSKNINHLQHIKSSVVENGQPKLPSSEVLAEGEIALNFANGYETISILNSERGITRFSCDDYYTEQKLGSGFTGENSATTVTQAIDDSEKVISAALNDLNDRKLDASAYTQADLSNYYTKDETSGSTQLSSAFGEKADLEDFNAHSADTDVHVTAEEKEAWSGKADVSWVEERLGSGFTGENSGTSVTEYIEDNEKVISAALNDLESRKMDASAFTPTDLSNYYTKSETSGATEISDALSGKTDQTWIEEKLGSGFTGANSANTVTEVIEENEETTSAALNDLESRKLDASAYTPTDLSDYYTKDETSGATEIEAALSGKTDQEWIEEKLGSGFTGVNSGKTVTDTIDENEEVVSAALNDLESRKLDASAYTPTDLSNYYTKSQTSGATEIESALSGKTNQTWIEDKLGSGFTGANSAVTVTQALENIDFDIDQVLDNTTSASTNAVSTKAVYSAVTDNELVWTNAYVVLSGAVSSHTMNTSIHRANTVSVSQVNNNVTVTCPSSITGAENSGAQVLVIYENTSTTTDYTVSVSSGYKTPDGLQLQMTCPANGFCKALFINMNGTIYVSEA